MKKKIIILLCLSLTIAMFQNCSEFKSSGSNEDLNQISNFTYLDENLFTSSCLSCHSSVDPQGGINLSSYAEISSSGTVDPGNAQASSLYTVLDAGLAPHDQVDQFLIDAVELWINNGANLNENPLVDAGNDINLVLPVTSTTLFAQASDVDGEIATYLWVQGSGPNTAALSGEDTANLSVTGMVIGAYSFLVTVTDNSGNMATDTVNVTITDAPNDPPTVSLGADQTINLPVNSIALTGNASDSDGSIASYLWTQVSGPNTAVLSGATTNTLTASSLIVGTYVFNIVATDDDAATATDSINVVVAPEVPNNPPTVSLGVDQTINLPTNSVVIPATATDGDGAIVSYAWTQVTGPSTAVLSGVTTNTLTASSLVEGVYTFNIVVTDDDAATATDSINITVAPVAAPTLTQLRAQIFNSKCAGCHLSGGNFGNYNMDTYVNLMQRVDAGNSGVSSLYNEVNDETMPPGGNNLLNQSEKDMVRDWIDAGALDN